MLHLRDTDGAGRVGDRDLVDAMARHSQPRAQLEDVLEAVLLQLDAPQRLTANGFHAGVEIRRLLSEQKIEDAGDRAVAYPANQRHPARSSAEESGCIDDGVMSQRREQLGD